MTVPSVIIVEPGSMPLRNAKHERFARERALLMPVREAARRAGYFGMKLGNAIKIDHLPAVRERVRYLSGIDEEQIRHRRDNVERELNRVAFANMADFIRVSARGWPCLDLRALKELPEEDQRELLAAVKGIRYTENGPAFELHSKLDALAQLRKMNGFDAPEKHQIQSQITLEMLVNASYREKPTERLPELASDNAGA